MNKKFEEELGEMEARYDLTHAEIGDDLYHYTNVDGIFGILRNSQLFITHHCFLNDITELKYLYELEMEAIDFYIQR
ncbi:hypothetical protein, partial [Clostridium sp.]|uniref:hypothetical protein n=1 Tax=Clostridium sp. TaxID=1506 RepID=UPI003EEF62E6